MKQCFFLELLEEFNPTQKMTIQEIHKEGDELLRIIVSSIVTMRKTNWLVNRNSKI
jgi:hypothetical protein